MKTGPQRHHTSDAAGCLISDVARRWSSEVATLWQVLFIGNKADCHFLKRLSWQLPSALLDRSLSAVSKTTMLKDDNVAVGGWGFAVSMTTILQDDNMESDVAVGANRTVVLVGVSAIGGLLGGGL